MNLPRSLLLCLVLYFYALPAVVRADVPDATGYYAPDSLVSANYVLGPTSPGKWGPPTFGTGATISYSFMPSGVSFPSESGAGTSVDLATFMPAGFQAQIQLALAAWSAVANVVFVPVPDSGLPFNDPTDLTGIRFGGHFFDGPGLTLAHGFYPPVNGASAAGDIHFDSSEPWKIGFGGPGYDIFQVASHEIGHALGLDHSSVANSLMNPFYTEAFSGPQADDIAGAIAICGPAVVPEPGALSLIVLGLAAPGLRRSNRIRRLFSVVRIRIPQPSTFKRE